MEGMCSMKSRCQRTTGRVKVEEIMGRERGRAERVMGRKTREVLLKEEVFYVLVLLFRGVDNHCMRFSGFVIHLSVSA